MPSSQRIRRGLLLLALAWLWLAPEQALAQKDAPDIPDVSSVVAIQNARIVQAPGRIIESGTVVFRDGVITDVGRRVDIPYDARVIDGDSLTIYAGLIDALSHVGIPQPRNAGQPEAVPDRSNPPFDRAGITPERDARNALDAEDDAIEALRNQGFTAALVAPRGQMLPGSSTVALLGGTESTDMVMPAPQPMFFQFQGARGVYPGTPMGIMAQFRQLYREADRRMKLDAMYADDPSGMPRPPHDEVHAAFYPVISGSQSVAVWTNDVLEIHRALKLRSELGFNMALFGLSEGFDAVDAVLASGVPVALTLDLPDKPEWSAKMEADSLAQILASYTDETRTATFRDVEAEKRNLEARQLWSRNRYTAMAAQYAEAGIPFAFTTMGMDAKDIPGSVREMLDAGLSRDDMLAGFTTHAADLLGVSASLGTVESGKMANLVVTDGDLFAEKTHVKMVFVNGHLYEPSAASARRGGGRPNADR